MRYCIASIFMLLYTLRLHSYPLTDTISLKKSIRNMMDSASIPGMGIAILRNGKVWWHENIGVRNNKTREPLSSNTIFEAASLSKPVFAFLALQMVDKGLITLDTPLIEYVPEAVIVKNFLNHPIYDARFRKITARMCLSHSTGLPNGKEKILRIAFNPGTNLSYSGQGFAYLQFVIEYLTKKNLETLAKELIFEPLQMHSSTFVWSENLIDKISYAHGSLGECVGYRRYTDPASAYSLLTTPEDYGKFLSALLQQKILSSEIYAQIWQAQSTAKSGFLAPLQWGLGMGIYESPLGKAFWHWGDFGTAKALVVGIPEKKLGVVMFANTANGLNLTEKLLRITIGGQGHQPFRVLPFEQYDHPFKNIFNNIQKSGLGTGLNVYNIYKLDKDYRLTPDLLQNIGNNLLKSQRFKEALEIFKVNALEYPSSPKVYENLADAYWRLGKREAAIGCWKQAYTLNPSNAALRMKLKQLGVLH